MWSNDSRLDRADKGREYAPREIALCIHIRRRTGEPLWTIRTPGKVQRFTGISSYTLFERPIPTESSVQAFGASFDVMHLEIDAEPDPVRKSLHAVLEISAPPV